MVAIAQAHAEFAVSNMRSVFAAGGTRCFFSFPQHHFADVFDDVIANTVAIGAVGGVAGGVDRRIIICTLVALASNQILLKVQ